MTEEYKKCKTCEEDCSMNNLVKMNNGEWLHCGYGDEVSSACFECLCEVQDTA